MNILQATEDPNLFGPWFRDRATWQAWFAFLAALFALPMTDEQLAIYKQHTGRSEPPSEPSSEAWSVVGRRGGKSLILALLGVYLACFRDYRDYLQPGERATVMVIAADRRQARVIIRYIGAMLTSIPMLSKMLAKAPTADAFELTNQVTIEVGTASFRTTRGYTYAAVLADEIAFWRTDDAAEPDYAILDAIRPGMATVPDAMLLCASSPYARRGALWDAFSRYYGKAAGPLVWRASTREMNPTIRPALIAAALERDPASAAAEYLAQFRTDVEALLTREAVSAAIEPGAFERPYDSRFRYLGFVDPSGGSSDAMTLAIAHKEGETAIVDAVREVRPPFSPEAVTREFADVLKLYRLYRVTGDRYAGEFPRELFRKQGVTYDLAEKTRSELYLSLVALLNSRRVLLTDTPRLENQLVSLERRTTRGGKDTIDHPPGGHDDVANAVAGAIWLAVERPVQRVTFEPLRM